MDVSVTIWAINFWVGWGLFALGVWFHNHKNYHDAYFCFALALMIRV